MDDDLSFVRDLPFPIASEWKKLSSLDETHRPMQIVHCLEEGLRFMVAVSAAEYWLCPNRNIESDDFIDENLNRPTLGQLKEIFGRVAGTVHRDARFIPDFNDLVFPRDLDDEESQEFVSQVNADLSLLIIRRNELAHRPFRSSEEQKKLHEELLSPFVRLLKALSFLSEYKIVSTPSCLNCAILLHGPNPETTEDYQGLEKDKVYLVRDDGKQLCLTPYVYDLSWVTGGGDKRKAVLTVCYTDWAQALMIKATREISQSHRELPTQSSELDELSRLPTCPETSREILSRENSNVEKLKGLLDKYLTPDDRVEQISNLRDEGYDGGDDGILSEFCLVKDPVRLLTDCFSRFKLVAIARDQDAEFSPNAEIESVAKAILKKLEFHIVEEPKGIRATKEYVIQKQNESKLAEGRDAVIGLVTPLSTKLEEVLHGLLVFYGNFFFGEKYEDTFAEWFRDFGSPRRTLGMMWNILNKLEKEVLGDIDRKARLISTFQRDFVIGRKALAELKSVVPERANLSHFKDFIEDLNTPELKEMLNPMIEQSLTFLKHLDKNNIFPSLIRIDKSVEDRYGRRYLDCIDDCGVKQKVFTNDKVDPRKHYFMHPLTNPVRMYPILVQYRDAE